MEKFEKGYPKRTIDKLTCEDCCHYDKPYKKNKKENFCIVNYCGCKDRIKPFVYKIKEYDWKVAFDWSLDATLKYIIKFKDPEYYDYKNLIPLLKNDIYKISTNILDRGSIIPIKMTTVVPPNRFIELLHSIKSFAYKSELLNYDKMKEGLDKFPEIKYTLLSLEEQQQKCKEYYHFDFSVKKPKVLKPGGIK